MLGIANMKRVMTANVRLDFDICVTRSDYLMNRSVIDSNTQNNIGSTFGSIASGILNSFRLVLASIGNVHTLRNAAAPGYMLVVL
jgi:hypothetical protein